MKVSETAGSYNVRSGVVSIQVYHTISMTGLEEGKRQYATSQYHRSLSLLHYKNCGEGLYYIREVLRGAKKTSPVETDMGSFRSFEQYLDTYYCGEESESGIQKAQARKYLYLYENWDVVSLLRLDKPEACYRLNITVQIISWGKKKRAAGIDLTTIDHHLYFDERDESKSERESSSDSTNQYDVARLLGLLAERDVEITSLRQEVQDLWVRLNNAEALAY